ncbi:hypothetical protein HIM_00539 [Hirsutella minnesotensis 3608]|nr:hypothetical protein HIM_00539 [Hirsutella minnesotensis 3608]
MSEQTDGADIVERDGKQYRPIKEGRATILVPQSSEDKKEDRGDQQVFYNPIQQYNRDLSILAIKAYGEWALEIRSQAPRTKNGPKKTKQGKKRKRCEEDASSASNKELKTEDKSENSVNKTSAEQFDEPSQSEETAKGTKPAFKILDALSASGLRGLRYGHELPFVTAITANDLSPSAAATICLNVEHNGLQNVMTVTNEDALGLMYRAIADDLGKRDRSGNPSKAHKFDVIDLDPYGTAAPFFDAAVQSVRDDGGLLCITCTDSAVWAGHSYCEKTFALYGGIPLKGVSTHEAALRLILNAVATSAARYGLAIEPLLSLSIDFYAKFFIRITRSPLAVKYLASRTMLVYNCDSGCGSWQTQPMMKTKTAQNKKGSGLFYKYSMALGPTADRFCDHCGSKMHVSGPMYAGHIHSQEFIHRVLDQIPQASADVYKTLPRLEGMLRTAQEEFIPGPPPPNDVDPKEAELATLDNCPFFVVPGKLASIVSCASPPDDMIRGALAHLGYQAGRSHCRPGSIKTDAPWSTIWWIMTEWIRQKSPIKPSKIKSSMPSYKILRDAGLLEEHEGGSEAQPQGSTDAKGEDVEMKETEGGEQKADENNQSNGDGEAIPSEQELRKTLVFNEKLAQLGRHKGATRYVRYQMNPRANWGPMTRARAH